MRVGNFFQVICALRSGIVVELGSVTGVMRWGRYRESFLAIYRFDIEVTADVHRDQGAICGTFIVEGRSKIGRLGSRWIFREVILFSYFNQEEDAVKLDSEAYGFSE